MSFDKQLENGWGKERRKDYRDCRGFDRTCRNHGSCRWCKENRTFKFRDKHPD